MNPIVVSGLAAHRAARAVAVDSITEEWREHVRKKLLRPVIDKTGNLNMDATSRRIFVVELIECPHCVGFHLGYITLAAYLFALHRKWRWLQFLVEIWAVAGIQSTFASAQAALDTFGHVDPDKVNEANEAEAR